MLVDKGSRDLGPLSGSMSDESDLMLGGQPFFVLDQKCVMMSYCLPEDGDLS